MTTTKILTGIVIVALLLVLLAWRMLVECDTGWAPSLFSFERFITSVSWKVDFYQPWFCDKRWLSVPVKHIGRRLKKQGLHEGGMPADDCPSPWQIHFSKYISVPVESGALKVTLGQRTHWAGLTVCLSPNLGPACSSVWGEHTYVDMLNLIWLPGVWKPLQQETTGRVTEIKGIFTFFFSSDSVKQTWLFAVPSVQKGNRVCIV